MSIEEFLLSYADAIELLHEVSLASDQYWQEAEESDEDSCVDGERIRSQLARRFCERVDKIGRVRYMTALFCETGGRGSPAITTLSGAKFIWMSLSYQDWCEVGRSVEIVYGGWYDLMWHLIGTIGIDYFAILTALRFVSENEALQRRQSYPNKIRAFQLSQLDYPTDIEVEQARELMKLRERLVSEGATAASVNEPENGP